MVDDRALRFRRRTPAGEPPNQTRTDSRLDALVRGYMRNQREGARVREEGLGSSAVESGVSRGVVPDTLSARLAGIGADMVADPLNVVPGLGLVVGGVGKAGRLSAIVNRLNKSTDVRDFMTEQATRYPASNYANQGLYRGPDSVGGFTDKNLPDPAEDYLFGLVPTEKLSPLREYDRMADPGTGAIGRGNVERLIQHMAEGGKWDDPLSVAYYIEPKTGYLAEGNHRLALAEALGLEQLPTRVWRQEYGEPPPGVGRYLGDLDANQLTVDAFGDPYIPPTMHPYLLKYFRPQ